MRGRWEYLRVHGRWPDGGWERGCSNRWEDLNYVYACKTEGRGTDVISRVGGWVMSVEAG